jgi:hypothetical protein
MAFMQKISQEKMPAESEAVGMEVEAEIGNTVLVLLADFGDGEGTSSVMLSASWRRTRPPGRTMGA